MRVRTATALILAAMIGVVAGSGFPFASTAPRALAQTEAKDKGAIRGTIADVNYSSGAITIATGHGRIAVQVTPSTNIFFDRSGYATMADLTQGTHVEVFVSKIEGRLVAQIIRIK